ncbi:MAG: 4-hydroxy-tetrahydrodipicolinate reductase [Bacillota bacterium]
MIHVAVCGTGRASMELIRAIKENEDFEAVAAFCRPGSLKAGKDIGALAGVGDTDVEYVELTDAGVIFAHTKIDVAIDFSTPETSKCLLNACFKHGIPCVICTTGFTDEEIEFLIRQTRAKKAGVVYAPNVTIGVNVLISLLKAVAKTLPQFDYQITEIHHSRKLDRPSGTAKRIADTLEDALKQDGSVPINSVRAGGYVGIHEVTAAGDYERLTLTHESFSRRAFADGALVAAKYVINRIGWYYMEDVLNIDLILTKSQASNLKSRMEK